MKIIKQFIAGALVAAALAATGALSGCAAPLTAAGVATVMLAGAQLIEASADLADTLKE